MTGNETYLNTQLGYKVLAPQGGISLKRFVVDTVHNQVIIGGTATGAANTQVRLEFFVPIQPPPDNQGGAYMDSADVNVTLDASGTKSFFHQFGAAIVFDGVGFDPPVPFAGNIDDTDSIVASTTANSTNSTGTSEFSQPSTATLPGDFDLDGYVAGSDFMIWQQNVGKINPKYWEGDADFDGDVDSVDLDIWGENFGEVP